MAFLDYIGFETVWVTYRNSVTLHLQVNLENISSPSSVKKSCSRQSEHGAEMFEIHVRRAPEYCSQSIAEKTFRIITI